MADTAINEKGHTFSEGCMWEGGEWEIRMERECSEFGGGEPCRHCHSIKTVNYPNFYGDKSAVHKRISWICPAVVIARNEGGYCTTGMCLDCIIEAALKIKRWPDG